MAKEIEKTKVVELPKVAVETKTVSVSESQNLQKEGWVVIEVKRVDGVKVHTLQKG